MATGIVSNPVVPLFTGTVTNLSVYIPPTTTTNLSFVTNGITVTGAGTTNANGSYTFTNGVFVFATNTFTNEPDGNGGWIFVHALGGSLYGYYDAVSSPVTGPYSNFGGALQGANPAPIVTVSITTNATFVTNILSHYNLTTYSNGAVATNIFQ